MNLFRCATRYTLGATRYTLRATRTYTLPDRRVSHALRDSGSKGARRSPGVAAQSGLINGRRLRRTGVLLQTIKQIPLGEEGLFE